MFNESSPVGLWAARAQRIVVREYAFLASVVPHVVFPEAASFLPFWRPGSES